ncbi:RrF2 family transcriptional regulator [Paludibacterium yongneupense]|uniref:RrF2 family transcriptional regulator n=1 Tax=Paludibacterium yongneupense TaxID=400061 RepID=UPI0003F83319|nr:Rrf2 family transcriptional regulator [Paludibacterium yongneupense]
MNLTRFSDYSLRVLILAGTYPERLVTIAEIADVYAISENHLMKVVHRLAQIGVLDTVRGKGGGLRLARSPSEINLGAIVRQTEQGQPLVECFGVEDNHCRIVAACELKTVLAEAQAAFYEVLSRYTLADLLRHPRQMAALIPLFA